MKIETARRYLWVNALKMDCDYSEKAIFAVAQKMAKKYDKLHDFYCPRQKPDASTVCPCEHFTNTGSCLCGLYRFKDQPKD